jgi:hypothetical protein
MEHETARECGTRGRDTKCAYFSRKPEGKGPLQRPRRRRKDNINMDLKEIRTGGCGLDYLTQDCDQWSALVNTVMNLLVP